MEKTRSVDPRLVGVVLAVAFAAAALWAAAALAGGDTPSSDNAGRDDGPLSAFIQEQEDGPEEDWDGLLPRGGRGDFGDLDEEDGLLPWGDRDCPEDEGDGGGGGGDGGSDDGGSGSGTDSGTPAPDDV